MSNAISYSIREITDVNEWDQLHQLSERPSPFCTATWIQGISGLFSNQYKLLAIVEEAKVLAICCVYFRSKFGQLFSFHPPLTPYNSPHFIRPEKKSDQRWEKDRFNILTFLQEYISKNFIYPYLFLDSKLTDMRPFTWNNWNVRPAYTYCVDPHSTKLDPDITRRARNCLKEGYSVSFEWTPEIFVDLFRLTMERQNIKLNYSDNALVKFLNELHTKKLVWMITSYDANKNPHASWVQLQVHQHILFNWNSATNLAFSNSGGTSLLVYELLNKLISLNTKEWDLCGADNPSVSGFKSKLGGELALYFKADYSNYPLRKKIYLKILNKGL